MRDVMETLLARSVVAGYLARHAKEFSSPEALKQYLHDHPDADKSKHFVKKPEQKATGDGKPKAEPKDHKDQGHDDEHDEHHEEEKPKKSWKDRLKGLSEKATSFLKEAPKNVKKFVQDDSFRRKSLMAAHDSLMKAPEKIAKNAIETVKHEVKEYKEAGQGIGQLMKGKKMSSHQKKALRTVATHMAIGVAAAALTASGPLAIAGAFGKGMAKHVAMKAVSNMLGHVHVLEELGHVGHGIKHIMEKLSAEEGKADPEKVLANFVIAAVAKEIKGLKDDDLKAMLEDMSGGETDEKKAKTAAVRWAMEFNTPEALKQYLHDHPNADKSNHSVKKKEEESGGAKDKPKGKAVKKLDFGDTSHLGKDAKQKTGDKDQLFKDAAAAHEHQLDWLNRGKGIDKALGATVVRGDQGEKPDFSKEGPVVYIGPMKEMARSGQKVDEEYGGDWSRLGDIVRSSVAVDTYDEVEGVLKKLQASGLKLARKPKDRMAEPLPDSHYRDVLLNVEYPNGHVGELQLHVKPMLQAKKAGHKFYDQARVVSGKAKKEGRTVMTPEEQAIIDDANAKARPLYDRAWAQATGELDVDDIKNAALVTALAVEPRRKAIFDFNGLPAKWEKGKWPVLITSKGEKPYYDMEKFYREAVPVSEKEFEELLPDEGKHQKKVVKHKSATVDVLVLKVAARFQREAFLRKLARMTVPEAEKILGVRPGASPEEIKAAHKKLVLELHPDRNKDRDTTLEMAQVNAAKDVLDGKPPGVSYPDDGGSSYDGPSYSGPRTRAEPPKKNEVTFDEAYSKAGVPAGVEWMFVTDGQRGTGYSSDEFYRSEVAKAAYGKTDTKHVFVGMYHKVYQELYIGGRANNDVWSVRSLEFPISGDEGKTPAWLYGNVIKALKAVGFDGRFNSKVFDVKGKGWKPDAKSSVSLGSAMSIKHWLVNAGEVEGDAEAVVNRKHVVEIKTEEKRLYGEEKTPPAGFYQDPSHYSLREPGGTYTGEYIKLTLIINGKPYELSEADWGKFAKVRGLYDKIFGQYVYGGKSKQLTRSKDGKKILLWMSEKFTDLPEQARAALAAASAQMKG